VRQRRLISSYETNVYRGAYWGIGTEIEAYTVHGPGYGQTTMKKLVLNRLRAVRIDFDAVATDEQLILMNHSWALADAALRTFMSDVLLRGFRLATSHSQTDAGPSPRQTH